METKNENTKRNFLTYLVRGNVLACQPIDEEFKRADGPAYQIEFEDFEPEIVNGQVEYRAIKRRIKSRIEVKKTGVMVFEVRVTSYFMNGKHGLATVIVAIVNG